MKRLNTKMAVVIAIVVLAVDQITKIAIQQAFDLHESLEIIPNFFSFTYAQNTGAAWSIFSGGNMWVFLIIGVVFLGAMLYFYKETKAEEWLTRLGIVLMMSGTLGNMIDRFFLHYVRDFLDFIILGYDFPIFNVADMGLCIGVGLVFLAVIIEEHGVKKI